MTENRYTMRKLSDVTEEKGHEMKEKKTGKVKRIMKQSGNLVFSIATIVLTMIVLFTATFAWFSMNKDVSSNGMKMTVETTSSLIICDYDSLTGSPKLIGNDAESSYTFTTDYAAVHPATHGDAATTSPSGLKYVTTLERVSRSSGLAADSEEPLLFANVPVPTGGIPLQSVYNGTYFVDYVVCIASLNKELSDFTTMKAYFKPTPFDSSVHNNAYKAASIDFYIDVGDGNGSTYKGTLNVAQVTADSTAYVELISKDLEATSPSIPKNTDGFITITLRCYYDGALESSSGQAYVTSDDLAEITKTAQIEYGVKIVAE